MMMLKWFNAREAADLGAALADQFAAAAAPRPAPVRGSEGKRKEHATALQELHERADREVRPLELNFYQKARFANAFKWRLIENGVESGVADGVTESLIMHLSQGPAGAPTDRGWAAAQGTGPKDPARPTLCLRVPRRPSRRAIMPKPWIFLMSLCRLSLAARTL